MSAELPVDLLACPSCRGPLTKEPGRLRCAKCAKGFPVEDGVANFV